jgi:hypothetical protein
MGMEVSLKRIFIITIILFLLIGSYYSVTVFFCDNSPQIEWITTSGNLNIKKSPASNSPVKINDTAIIINLKSDYPPDSVYVEVRNQTGDVVLEQETPDMTIPVIQNDGLYHYFIELNWTGAEDSYKGSYTYQFDFDIDLPAFFEFTKLSVLQGDMLKVYVYNVSETELPVLKQSIYEAFEFYKTGTSYTGYIPTNFNTKPGQYEIEYGFEGSQPLYKIITVQERDFSIQHMEIDPDIDESTRNDNAYAEYDKFFKPTRLSSNNELYYTDTFIIPAVGELTTEYGEIRYVNGSPASDRHSGLDIAASEGSPVYAANRGKVVLSMFLILTGNTIVIDHGQGLFSVYFHMNELIAAKGILVERGQKIGTVGTTGFSTGPHLHFTMSYYSTNIEPGYFSVGEPVTLNNYKKHLK